MTHGFRYFVVASAIAIATMGSTPVAGQRGGGNDQATLNLLTKTTRDAQQFDRAVDLALGKNPNRPVNPTGIENDADQLVNELIEATTHLRDHVTRREAIAADVEDVLIRAARIDQYMTRNQFAASVEQSWVIVRRDLDQVAQAFRVTWDWTSPRPVPSRGPAYYSRLSGTYQLDRARSDDARRIAVRAAQQAVPGQRQRLEADLINRLDPPEFLAIEREGRSVSIASSKAPRGTFEIDGQPHAEPNGYGGTSTVRAVFYGDELNVTTTGSRGRDFTVAFEPLNAGDSLRVTRTLDAAGLTQPVRAQSVYRRNTPHADWNVFDPDPEPAGGGGLVPMGTIIVGTLNEPLGSRTSRQGDLFSLTVTGPRPFQGAVIDGFVSRVNAPNGSNRKELIFDFDRIRMRDGRASGFEGILSQIRTPDGRIISVDTEGVVKSGSSRSNDVVTGGAVGAAFGALIGAIANGGKGAAIGAAAGAGAGAGMVYVVGTQDLNLPRGTEVQVLSQAVWTPTNVTSRRR
jgi:hypothetical protein